jgi:hypothetical protein
MKEGSGVSRDYANPTRRHAEEGQAERGEDGEGSGVSSGYGSPTRSHAEECQVERSGQA